MDYQQFFEAVMLVAFGASWPMQLVKTIRVKNPLGKSLFFLYLIVLGYLAGIVSKFFAPSFQWVILLYAVNAIMVATDIALSHYYLAKIKMEQNHEQPEGSH